MNTGPSQDPPTFPYKEEVGRVGIRRFRALG